MKKYNIITGAIILLIFAFAIFIIVMFNLPDGKDDEFDYLKNYKVNEYMPVYVSEEKMASIYHNDYINYLMSDPEIAYNLLDKDYKARLFDSLESFIAYTEKYKLSTIKSYSVENVKNKRIFYLRLSDDLELIFSTTGVMKYVVYFDELTVGIE